METALSSLPKKQTTTTTMSNTNNRRSNNNKRNPPEDAKVEKAEEKAEAAEVNAKKCKVEDATEDPESAAAAAAKKIHKAEEMKAKAGDEMVEALLGDKRVEALKRTLPERIKDPLIATELFHQFDEPEGENPWAVAHYMENWLHDDLKGNRKFASTVLLKNGYMADWFSAEIQKTFGLLAAETSEPP